MMVQTAEERFLHRIKTLPEAVVDSCHNVVASAGDPGDTIHHEIEHRPEVNLIQHGRDRLLHLIFVHEQHEQEVDQEKQAQVYDDEDRGCQTSEGN